MGKKEHILQAALELLVENGIHATPVSMISKKAKTGMGTIYNYFQNKDVLINAIYVDIKTKEKNVLESVFESELPVKVQFENYYRSMVQFFIENPLFFSFMDQLQASPIITTETKEVGLDAIEHVLELIAKGKKEHIIKNIDNNELLQFIGGSMLSYLRWINRSNESSNLEDTLSNQIRLVWDGIKE